MPLVTHYVSEQDLDYDAILAAIGADSIYGDEDFDVFQCPFCSEIYLIDYEIDVIFYDPVNFHALSEHASAPCLCISCGYDFSGQTLIGEKASEEFKVPLARFKASAWGQFLLPSCQQP